MNINDKKLDRAKMRGFALVFSVFPMLMSCADKPVPAASPLSSAVDEHTHPLSLVQSQGLMGYGQVAIDGVREPLWNTALVYPMEFSMDGSLPAPLDFRGSVSYLWQEEGVNVLVEITDDVISDQFEDPLDHFWADDVLEVFFDPDASGGPHRYSYQAFAYHIALDGAVVDGDERGEPIRLDEHLLMERRFLHENAEGSQTHLWELRVMPHTPNLKPFNLSKGMNIGMMVYYCDNDGTYERQHFMGDFPVLEVNDTRDRGWLDASTFRRFRLTGEFAM